MPWARCQRLRPLCTHARLRLMRGIMQAGLGVVAFVVAGFVYGGARNSPDPELVLAVSAGFAGCGLLLVIAAGVAIGIQVARE